MRRLASTCALLMIACQCVENVDPTYEGYRVIAELYGTTYESLPASFGEPFISAR